MCIRDSLRSAEFLNVSKFPQATFTSTSVKKEGNDLDITGNPVSYTHLKRTTRRSVVKRTFGTLLR